MSEVISAKDGRSYHVSIKRIKYGEGWVLLAMETRRYADNSTEPFHNWSQVFQTKEEAISAMNEFIATGELND